ncbi:ArsR family transcriptional regulator [Sphingomonas sp. LH128]|nr:ArsR family transcriptional regulator [Sphingomonas sp. LH128]
METDDALSILSALAHPTRLDAFRVLIRHEPDGLSTGKLVEASGLTQSTFSTHLAVMAKAGLVLSEKRGRQQIQRANLAVLRGLMVYLAKDCCQGRAELCEPLPAELPAAEEATMIDIVIYHNPLGRTYRSAMPALPIPCPSSSEERSVSAMKA